MAVVTVSSRLTANGLLQRLNAEATVVQEACPPPGETCGCAGAPCTFVPDPCCPGFVCAGFSCVPW
jgi:hypothetical protein